MDHINIFSARLNMSWFLRFLGEHFLPSCWVANLHASLGEINPARQILPDEGVGVMRPLEHPLQGLQLTAVKRGPVSPLLPFLLLL